MLQLVLPSLVLLSWYCVAVGTVLQFTVWYCQVGTAKFGTAKLVLLSWYCVAVGTVCSLQFGIPKLVLPSWYC